jgi:NAD+ kinase
MKIALLPNTTKNNAVALAEEVSSYLRQNGVEVISPDQNITEDTDFIITIGGDGTILQAVHQNNNLDFPILGIHLGSLGFMTDIPTSDLYPSLQNLVNGTYTIEKRLVIENSHNFAINDIVLHRDTNHNIIDLAIHIDGKYLNTFAADGIIISTPTGSTAYSLAAGGPIIDPSLEAIVITPICPHTISNRPIVLSPSQDIQIEYLSHYKPITVTYDGTITSQLKTNEILSLRNSEKTFKLVNIGRRDYFSAVRAKLNWTGRLR